MKHINYRTIPFIFIGLLILGVLASCTKTRQAMNSREQMEVFIPGNEKKTHNKSWGKGMLVGGLLAAGTLGGMAYMNMLSSFNITGLNNTNSIPENLYEYNSPRAMMLMADMPNTASHDPYRGESLMNIIQNKSIPINDIISLIQKTPKENLLETDEAGENPLIYSIMYRKTNLSKLLINKMDKEDLGKVDDSKKTALIHAIERKSEEHISKFLIEKMNKKDLNKADKSGTIPLMHAVKDFQYDIAKLLINKMDKEDLGKVDDSKKTALIHAIERNSEEHISKFLIEKMNKKDLNKADSQGKTALMYALSIYQEGITKLLINKIDEEDLNKADKSGNTPLMYAVICDRIYPLKLLIEKKVNCFQADNEGITPLMYAVNHHKNNMIQLLVQCESDIMELKKREAAVKKV